MAEQRCPMCGLPNPEHAETCEHCGARLKPLVQDSPDNRPIAAGEFPGKKETEEFEDIEFLRKLQEQKPIEPGSMPRPQDTSELESTLPSWLRHLRGMGDDEPGESEEPAPVPAEPEVPEPAAEPADDIPDWLAGLTEAGSEKDETGELPDWLAALGESVIGATEAGESEKTIPETEAAESADLPDWLDGLGEESAVPEVVSEPEADESADLPDWLGGLGEESAAPEAVSEPESVESADLPDWLSGLGDESAAPEAVSEPESVESADLPDWLAGLGEESAAPEAVSEPESVESADLPDWLSGLGDESAAPEAVSEPESVESADLPDWLSGLGDESAAPEAVSEPEPAESADLPDWLSGLGDESAAPEAVSEPESVESADLPDWLSGLGDESAAPEAVSEPEPAESADLPDWLAGLGDESAASEGVSEPESVESADLPDWLSGLGGESAALEAVSEPEPAESADLPDWLAGLGDESAAPEAVSEPESVESADLPDWLAGLGDESVAPEAVSEPESVESADLPDWLSGLGDESAAPEAVSEPEPAESADLPDWLAGVPAESAASDLDAALEEKPDWLSDLTPVGEEEPEPVLSDEAEKKPALVFDESEDLDVLSDALPDWLAALKPDADEEAPSGEEAAEEDLSPAELPSWVQSMRPLDDVLDETLETGVSGDSAAEQSGPLRGLRGVLPLVERIRLTFEPKIQSYKLDLTEGQQQTMALLESLLAEEKQPKPARKAAADGPMRFIRWGVAFSLILVISLIQLFGSEFIPPVSKYPRETLAFMDAVNQIAPEQPVLLVTDYDTAFMSEMEWALTPVVQHLQVQNARVVTVSTQPVGAALADRLLPDGLHLGYVPGGPAGILGWALSPTEITPVDVQGNDVWGEGGPLTAVRRLGDFSLVIVATHDPALARQWVEQTELVRGDTAFLMVVSAQAEPLVRPYYDSGQVDGLVTGVFGGEAYASLNGFSLSANRWSAYSLATLLSALLVAAGSVWSLFAGWQRKRQEAQAEDDEQ